MNRIEKLKAQLVALFISCCPIISSSATILDYSGDVPRWWFESQHYPGEMVYHSDMTYISYRNLYSCIYEYVNYQDPYVGGCADSFDLANSATIAKLAKKGEQIGASLGLDGYEVYVTVEKYFGTKPNGGVVQNGYAYLQVRKRDFAPQKELLPPTQCPDPNPVAIGNPFMAAGGIKSQTEIDAPDSGEFGISFKRYYSSRGAGSTYFGPNWSSDYTAQLVGNFTLSQSRLDQGIISNIQAYRDNGAAISFSFQSGTWLASGTEKASLAYQNGIFLLQYEKEGLIERYDATGKLLSRTTPNGQSLSITYAAGSVVLSNNAGRTASIALDSVGRAQRFTNTAGLNTVYTYESAALGTRLSLATNNDLSSRKYLYAHPTYLGALTGIQDEKGVAYVTWGYDSVGLANSSTLTGAGGSDSVVKISADTYSAVDPTGQARTLTFSNLGGRSLLTAQSQPAGAGCGASSRAFSYDANGNVASQVDFNGIRSCYSSRLDRNLQVKRVEGLAGASACGGVLADGAALPASSRKFTTEWHPDWRLPTRSAGPGVVTNDIYNGQPDLFNGGTLAACAPATALLPDGKPIAVLCRRVEQATSDTDGSLGFAAPLAAVATADQRWTYNQDGQVLTHDGPRTDVADVTYYAYYSDTTADHTRGDLQTLTNPAGHVSNYLRYNAAGQLLTMMDPNGVTTTNTYDLRQRLTSTTVGGLTTVYTYDLAGQLVRVTNPDGAYAGYTYDAAHRLIAAFDNLGNRIDYTLDATGKRTAERVNDESGVLRRQLSRSFDALGRPQQITGRE